MTDIVNKAAKAARKLQNEKGRASTPIVPETNFAIDFHPIVGDHAWTSVVTVGDDDILRVHGIDTLRALPNSLVRLSQQAYLHQAIVVNSAKLVGPWRGSLEGSSSWKVQLIYDALVSWRSAGLPAYLILPSFETVPLTRWRSVSSAVIPWTPDGAEETGAPVSALWSVLLKEEWFL